mmetsp:Transcript_21719/g.21419  ORF Transcript_21719/g.21419 Transcript_21719/m.21419 type:complete len:124 (+) Transcript_21719:544-915(+)
MEMSIAQENIEKEVVIIRGLKPKIGLDTKNAKKLVESCVKDAEEVDELVSKQQKQQMPCPKIALPDAADLSESLVNEPGINSIASSKISIKVSQKDICINQGENGEDFVDLDEESEDDGFTLV